MQLCRFTRASLVAQWFRALNWEPAPTWPMASHSSKCSPRSLKSSPAVCARVYVSRILTGWRVGEPSVAWAHSTGGCLLPRSLFEPTYPLTNKWWKFMDVTLKMCKGVHFESFFRVILSREINVRTIREKILTYSEGRNLWLQGLTTQIWYPPRAWIQGK